MSDWLFIAVTGVFFLCCAVKAMLHETRYSSGVWPKAKFMLTLPLGFALWTGFLVVLIYAMVPAFNAFVASIWNALS